MVPQVARDEDGHTGLTTHAVPQVEDKRIGGGDQAHRGGDDLPAHGRREKDRLQVQVPDIAREALRAGYAAAGLVGPPGQERDFLGIVAALKRRRGELLVVVLQPQVLIAVDRLQVGGDSRG